MKRATALPAYSNLQAFSVPEGITELEIDAETLQLATPACPLKRREVFIQGSEPSEFCERHGGVMLTQTPPGSWLMRLFGGEDPPGEEAAPTGAVAPAAQPQAATAQPQPAVASATPEPTAAARPRRPAAARPAPAPQPAEPATAPEEKKPGLLERIFGIFGSSRAAQEPAPKSP
jgi:hypothetical protein